LASLESSNHTFGPNCQALEEEFAAWNGNRFAITTNSGTAALHMAVAACGCGTGDHVLVTAYSWSSSATCIIHHNALPVFVDIDPRTYNLDPAGVAGAITPRTRAVMPVSLYGQCADLDAINSVACAHELPVIEDGAQSFGATYRGRRSCALSLVGSTSFFPSKPLGGYGDGGALFTDDDALATSLREIRVHGQDRRYHHPRLGLNGRLDSIQAAVLLSKMEIFEDEVAARIAIGARYSALLAEAFAGRPEAIRLPYVEPFNTCVYAQYTIEVDDRDAFESRMKALGVPTAVHYPQPLHLQPVFEHLGQREGRFPSAEAAARRVVSLPMHPYLSEVDQAKVVRAVREAVG